MCAKDTMKVTTSNKNDDKMNGGGDDDDDVGKMESIPLDDTPENDNNKKNTTTGDESKKEDEHGDDPLKVWQKSLEDQNHCLSHWTLSYLNPLLEMGANKLLDANDIGVPSQQDLADVAYEKTLALWLQEKKFAKATNEKRIAAFNDKLTKCKTEKEREALQQGAKSKPKLAMPSLAKSILLAFGQWEIYLAIFYYVIGNLLTFVPVLILNDLVKFFQSGVPFDEYSGGFFHPWLQVVALCLVPMLIALLQTRHQTILSHCAVFTRTAVSTLLYQKSLSVSAAGRNMTSTGQVVNMMSNDAAQLQRFLQFLGNTVTAPMQIIIALALIYNQVGNATWVGVAFMIFLAPINVWVFGVVSKQRQKVLTFSDARVKMMNEILSGIRIIKFYAWERPFNKEVATLRSQEMQALTHLAYVTAVGFSLILLSAPLIQPILVFMTYVYIQDQPLDAATAFTTVALFNIMRFPFAFLPMGLLQYIQSRIALQRLQRYLDLPELAPYVVPDAPPPLPPSDVAGTSSMATGSVEADSGGVVMDDDFDVVKYDESVRCQPGSVTIHKGSFSWINPDADPIQPIHEEKKARRLSKKEQGARGSQTSNDNKSGGGGNGSSHRRSRHGSRRSKNHEEPVVVDEIQASIRSRASSHTTASEGTSKVPTITLRDLTFTIPAGSLVAVVGTVGSGKSSILSAILGEMEPINNSKVYLPGGRRASLPPNSKGDGVDASSGNDQHVVGYTSYCAQTPWVVNDTVRGNVLFGRPFQAERYEQVLTACALQDDLAILPAGDLTEIGERGINLSGGQKARVGLARALYSAETQLMLLDDPLSAVDAHVGEHIFTQAIAGDIVQGITRILVTHHVHLLSRCDAVMVMERGRIEHYGTYKDLVARGVDFAGAVDISKAQGVNEEVEKDASNVVAPEVVAAKNDKTANKTVSSNDESTVATTKMLISEKETAVAAVAAAATKAQLTKSGKKLVSDEEREEGNVSGSIYVHYARVGGWCVFMLGIFISGLGRALEILSGFWLAEWAEQSILASQDGTPMELNETNKYLGVYAALGMGGVICLTLRAVVLAVHRLYASVKLHDDLAERVMRAPVAFFDVTPTGRVLNRFAADMDKIDLELSQSISQGISTIFSVFGALGAITAATKGTFLIPMVPLGYLYFVIQKWFRQTSTELQRLNSIANSPIFADFSQTLVGTSTIRAYGEVPRFFNHCKQSFDTMNASYALVQMTSNWLGLRLDVLGGVMSGFIGGVAVATYSSGFIPAGWLGLALSYSIEVTNYLKHGVKMIATLEAQMNSVERVLFYSENIAQEAPEYVPDKDPEPGTWPKQGEIELKNMSMRYRDGPLVLKDLSLTVKGGEKVGVCGRTGSGKSSLMVALFRISEIDDNGGMVLIDGVETGKIGTSTLRLNLSIIPQDPVIFSNTVRYNLDPFRTASDAELWETLRKVQMDEVVAELPSGLEEQVAEGGENFSQGQRQLLCIARSLLRKPKILVMVSDSHLFNV
jgi:ABC-type multidrug transport system fused ATPase/permease subunit